MLSKIKSSVSVCLVLVLFVSYFSSFKVSFAATHSAGTNVISNGTIYMITDDAYRRPYTSAGAFLSYGFNTWKNVVNATPEDLALPEGSFIPPRDGKIVCSDRGDDKGTCYLITNGTRAAFVSAKVFGDLGFSFSRAISGDVSFLLKDADISTSSEQHRAGVLINKNGTIYLVSLSGLMGIPSVDVLGSWGYTFQDAVSANSADGLYSQGTTISRREGAKLSPGSIINEDSFVQSSIDTYPDFSSKVISAPQDGAQVIELVKVINAIPTTSVDSILPYLTSQSLEVLRSAPQLKASLQNSNSIFLPAMGIWSSNIQVFEGDRALYTDTQKQASTSYISDYYWACKKENGVWKWDLLGTWKYYQTNRNQNNPSQSSVTGVGYSDLDVPYAIFTENPKINDTNTFLLAEIKNGGQTTVKMLNILVKLNGTIIAQETEYYEIAPGQSVVVAIPLGNYWATPIVDKTPGTYKADLTVGFDGYIQESNLNNNSISVSALFQEKPVSAVPNLVGQ